MLDDWFRTIELKITFDEYARLPRHPAYKQEYYDEHCVLTPRPKGYHAVLDLREATGSGEQPLPRGALSRDVAIRLLRDGDWDEMPAVLAAAFHGVSPFCSLDHDRGEDVEAARDCLTHTRNGGDGPVIEPACFVAAGDREEMLGALLVTLWPARSSSEWSPWMWPEPPPTDAISRRLGRPHLTWVFVRPWEVGWGIGTAMLHAAARSLRQMGFEQLASSFMSGNDSSILWHWRNGFRLLPYAGSLRRMQSER